MEFDVTLLGIVIGMMVLANRLVAMLVTPIFEKYSLDKFWLAYPAWILAGVFVWLTGVNLFAPYIPNELIGQILTAIVAGGGANLLYDLTDQGELTYLSNGGKNEAIVGSNLTHDPNEPFIYTGLVGIDEDEAKG